MLIPLAFYGSFDQSATIKELWKQVWSEVVPGSETGVRLYLEEIIELVVKGLASPNWPIKRQAGCALADVAKFARSDALSSHWTTIKSTTLDALKGRTWVSYECAL